MILACLLILFFVFLCVYVLLGGSIYLTYGVSNSIQRDLGEDGTDEERIKLTQYNEEKEKEAPPAEANEEEAPKN